MAYVVKNAQGQRVSGNYSSSKAADRTARDLGKGHTVSKAGR